MGIRLKFNLVMLFTFAIGITAAGFISHKMLQDNAREEILHRAGILMEAALAIRHYTVNEIRPLLADRLKEEFLPQTVPAYAATRNVARLRERYPEYSYKEATLNPTNPSSRATDWEASIVEHFRNRREVRELVGERPTATGRSLYMARPIEIKNIGCLTCHGTVDNAPTTMVARYGASNGFGWQINEVVGAQIVSVPMSVPLQRAEETFRTFMISLIGVFLAIIVILNIMLHIIVVRPVQRMSAIAHEVSLGNLDAPDCTASGKDEIASLGQSFNRMRRSMINALKMLDE
ncbi:MAG TPA: DUF3365 domain-containing protein [Gammaproteobacteria bacterium]|nr:DUF3365 domain-containing protein [Gammaproteobacteria bacterium]